MVPIAEQTMGDKAGLSDSIAEIRRAIAAYAPVYAALERLQKPGGLLPPGDQKTGCFGEFYGQLYLRARAPNSRITAGGHSKKCWDFRVEEAECESLIQVKTVSQYSKTRVLSPIHEGWHELFIFFLDKAFLPTGFWVIKDSSFTKSSSRRGLKCPEPDGKRGSREIPFGPNRIEEWRQLTGLDAAAASNP